MVSAVILCGGLAKRLRPVTDSIPKALIEINGKPLIRYQLEWLANYGIHDVVLACGYKSEELTSVLGNSVKYSIESAPLGTAGALRKACDYIKNDVVVVNGDNISDLVLDRLIDPDILIPRITLVKYFCPYGVYQRGKFEEKPKLPFWINAGIYYFSEKAKADLMLTSITSLENDYFSSTPISVYKHRGLWLTVDTPKDIEVAQATLPI